MGLGGGKSEGPRLILVARMNTYFAQGLGILSLVLEILILVRAMKGRYASRFPFFYTFLAYVFFGSAIIFYGVRNLWPRYYSGVYWSFFLIGLLAEFAVLVEISDHIFSPYVAIRNLGRIATGITSIIFFILVIRPVLMASLPSSLLIPELVKFSSLTKAVIIVCLLAIARSFDLPMTANTSSMMAGLGLYLASNIVNFELLARLGAVRYGTTFALVGPVSYTLCLLVWTVSLWRFEPAVYVPRGERPESATYVPDLLGRFNNSLSRLLRK